jgi:hypothetical protein
MLGALVLNLSLAISYVGLWLMQAQRGNLWRADFSAFYTSWAMVRDGKGSLIYNFELEKQYQWYILGERSFSEGLLPFINPPHVALVFSPLANLSLLNAFAVWTLLQVGLLFWLFCLLKWLAADWTRSERTMLLITTAALPSMLINFLLGAFSLLMLVCVLLSINALRRNRQIPAGLWFLIGLIKPQVMVFLGVALLATRRWRALFAIFCGAVVIFLISSLALGWNTWPDYVQQLREFSNFFGKYSIDPEGMYNLRGTLVLLLGKQHAIFINTLSIFALIGSLIFTFFLWQGNWRVEDATFELRMALTLILGSLFNIHAFPQDGLLVIAPAALFYDYLCRRGLSRRVYASFLLLCPTLFIVSEFTIGGRLGIRITVLAMIVLTCWICITLLGEKNKSSYVHQ